MIPELLAIGKYNGGQLVEKACQNYRVRGMVEGEGWRIHVRLSRNEPSFPWDLEEQGGNVRRDGNQYAAGGLPWPLQSIHRVSNNHLEYLHPTM